MLRAALWLSIPLVVACNPCPAGTRSFEVPLTGTETEKFCRSEGGILHGPYERYGNGALVVHGSYAFGDREGTWSTYAEGGALVGTRQFRQDQKTGTWRTWSPDGVLISEVAYDRDLKHGPERHWYEDGRVKLRGGNVEGRADGVWTAWHDNGQREWEKNFNLGVRDGAWTEWDADGGLLVRGAYQLGERDGVWEEWYPGGQRRMRVTYRGGVPAADAAYWDAQGNPRLAVTTGTTHAVDLDASLLSERERPPEPRLAWAFRPPGAGPVGAPAEVRDTVLVPVGVHLYGLKVNRPETGWMLTAPEALVATAPEIEADQAVTWTASGQLLVVEPLRVPGTWSLHRLDADVSVAPALSEPHVLFVGRDNRLHLYDRVEQQLAWSHPLDGEALFVGLAPERAWVLTTTGLLTVHELSDGEVVSTSDFRGPAGRPRWTSRPRKGFLLLWWSGDTLEAVRPLDGRTAWTWRPPERINAEEARIAGVSSRYGDLGVFLRHRVYTLDSTGSGELEATLETFADHPPAHFSACVSWGKVCVRADPDGRIDYPGGQPYLGTGLAAAPALGEDRLWVVTTDGWLGRLDFSPRVDVAVSDVVVGKVDDARFLLDVPGGMDHRVRKVRWTRERAAPSSWERLALDFGEHLPVGLEIEARMALPRGLDGEEVEPAWSVPWSPVGRTTHQEAWYRYRLYREVAALDFRELSAERRQALTSCQDRDRVEVTGALRLRGATQLGETPEFDTRLEGTFRLGSALFAKACAIIVSYQDPERGVFRNLGAFGVPGHPLGTTQPVRLELHGAEGAQPIGSVTEPLPPPVLEGVTLARIVQDSGFGPSRRHEVEQPSRLTVAGDTWTVRGVGGARVEVRLPELGLDTQRHGRDGETFEVVTWRARTSAIERGTYPVLPVFTLGAQGSAEGAGSVPGGDPQLSPR